MVAPQPSASAILWRRVNDHLEVFWVQRDARLAFAGGFYAFPGGRVDAADANAPVLQTIAPEETAHLSACARELFEETGVLCVRDADGARPSVSADERRALRRDLTERSPKSGERPGRFADLLRARGLAVDARDFAFAGRWITPRFMPIRFDARFYLVECPANETADVWEGELTHGEWIRPEVALARWRAGTALLHPPARHCLEVLAEDGPTPRGLERLRNPPDVDAESVAKRIDFQQGVLLIPLRTPTLPPWTHTNAFLLGEDALVLIDPGSPYPEEQAVLSGALRALASEGRRLTEILLTHWHHDHVAGAETIARETGARIVAHRETAARAGLRVDRLIDDGASWSLGSHRWRALYTPGHTRGDLCLLDESSGALLAGDTVAGMGTVVIDPPDGDMTDYVRSLERLATLQLRTIYPAHGPAIADGPAKITEYIRHRADREAQIARALAQRGRATPAELVADVYTDVSPALHPIAARSVLAVLEKLERAGKVRRAGSFFESV